MQSVKERCNCRSCWKQQPQKELSVAGAVGGVGPAGFPVSVLSVSLVCFIGEKEEPVFTRVSVSGMPSELRWLYRKVSSRLRKKGIHTVPL